LGPRWGRASSILLMVSVSFVPKHPAIPHIN
jgi:hypothetical protein